MLNVIDSCYLRKLLRLKKKTKADFHVGQTIQFRYSKTGQIVTGIIEKLNPTRAVVGQYTVPYAMLTI